MKTILLLIFIFPFTIYAQDTTKLRQVDSLVKLINNSDFEIKKDTIKQDYPETGLSMLTYLTAIINGTELKKYVNNVHITRKEKGVTKQMVTTSAFYFNHNKLIKVEESAIDGEKKIDMHWYYEEDTPIYYTNKSDKSQARAEFLLTIAKGLLEKNGFK